MPPTAESRWKTDGAELYVGPAGWSYDDWKGIVYPESPPKGFRAPTFLARYFNTIELNTTFYHPPRPGFSHRWVQDVADRPDFLYTAKLWRRFTHEREHHWTVQDVETFRTGIAPLVEADRLGALLVQFPWSFRFNRGNQQYLAELVGDFGDLPLVVEVRSRAWVQDRALEFLRSLEVGFCNIDQPALRGNVPLTAHGFGRVGYLRLHGRNREAWFNDQAGRDQRYDYMYDEKELEEIRGAMQEIAAQVQRMFVIANNHYRGQAVATGLKLLQRSLGEPIEAPGRVGELYGE